LEIDPKHVAALNNKGTALSNLGKYEEATLANIISYNYLIILVITGLA
jgi:hypothetical protein